MTTIANYSRYRAVFFDTLKTIFTDKGVLLIMIIAPIIYGVYYPLPYSNQVVRNVPIAIVDHAHDSLSRQIIRFVSASPTLRVHIVNDEQRAQQLLLTNEILAMMVIPNNLKKNAIKGYATSINIIGNGNYILASKNAQIAMAQAIGTVSAGIELKRLSILNLDKTTASAISNPVPLTTTLLNNRNEGYGSYIVPAVAWLILQQTLLIGCAMLVCTWIENKRAYAPPKTWITRIVTISCLHFFICLGYTGWFFSLWGYDAGGNPYGNLLLICLFSPCVAILGCLFGLLIKDRERTMQLLIFSSMPIFFLSGFSWPTQQLPELFQWLRWIFPSTSAIQAGISFNQLDGSIYDNRHYLLALISIGTMGLALLFRFGRDGKDGKGGRNGRESR